MADVYRETAREQGQADNVAQVGARYLLDPQTVLSASLGVGFVDDRDVDFRTVLGFQRILSVPCTRA